MSRPPSRAVIEAVELAEKKHHSRWFMAGRFECICGAPMTDGTNEAHDTHRRAEVARATEAAALRAAADDYFNISSGTKARPHARSWLRARANKLTDTDERSK